MERAAFDRMYDALHEALPFHDGTFTSWTKERNSGHPYHFRDGVTILATPTDLSPDDDFLHGPTVRLDESG